MIAAIAVTVPGVREKTVAGDAVGANRPATAHRVSGRCNVKCVLPGGSLLPPGNFRDGIVDGPPD